MSDLEIEEKLRRLEDEITTRRKEMIALKKELAGESVDDYELTRSTGEPVRLSELFDGRDELIVIHNMGRHCPYCTLWADGFSGLVDHLRDRAALVLVSPNKPEVQQAFAEERGWTFPMASSQDSTFTRDLGFEGDNEEGKTYYTPGVSTFTRDDDGTLRRVAFDTFGPGDLYNPVWHLFDLLAGGVDGWQPQFSYP
jgi:predicted dithiol-disulfide oxidoreductase (DUF899 family)